MIERQLNDTIAQQGFRIDDPEDSLRLSLAGTQEKTALLKHDGKWCRPLGSTPTTHILKLPLGTIAGGMVDLASFPAAVSDAIFKASCGSLRC